MGNILTDKLHAANTFHVHGETILNRYEYIELFTHIEKYYEL